MRNSVPIKLDIQAKKKQFNKENVDILSEFCLYLKSTGKSPLTIKGYINDIEMFFVWNLEENNNKMFVDFKKREIIRFQAYFLNEKSMSAVRFQRFKSSISSMANFVERTMDDDFPNFKNLFNFIENPKARKVWDKSVFSWQEIKVLIDDLVERGEFCKACFLALACSCGARKSELLRFKAHFFDESNLVCDGLYKTPVEIVTKGRGGKLLYKYTLKEKFEPYLKMWLEERDRLGLKSEYLFTYSKNGIETVYTVGGVNYWYREFTQFLGKDFYCHALRHTWCTELIKSNIPPSIIKDIAGWESLSMVDIYTDIDVDEKLAELFGKKL